MFTPDVTAQLKCYVYRLIDPLNGETFYIGRGQGNRVFDHVRGVSLLDKDEERNTKIGRIRQIINRGHDVIHVIHRHGMSEEAAIEVEAALIDVFPGLTNQQGGQGSLDFGPSNALEIQRTYGLSEVVFDDSKLIIIRINESTVMERKDRLEATRSAWAANLERANSCDYALSVTDRVIRGVYAVKGRWTYIPERGRIAFSREGATEVPTDILQRYLDKRLPTQERGAQNPISYRNA